MIRKAIFFGLIAALALAVSPPGSTGAEDYVVGEGDVLKITVYDHPDLTSEVRVGGGGNINFPLIGEVQAGGMTISTIVTLLTERLADGFIIDPQVTIFVKEFRGRKTTIMGEVKNPGLYELHGQTTFLELLSKAGGLTAKAGDRAIIKRKKSTVSGSGAVAIDLDRLVRKGDTSIDVVILDGDNVYVGEADVFYLTGEVKKPGAYKYEGGMTVVRAVTLAGGFSAKAARDRIVVIRGADGSEEVVDLQTGGAMDMPVRAGDSVYVPEAGVVYVTGEVQRPGAYAWEFGTTVIKAVALAGGFTDKAAEGRTRIIRRAGDEEKEQVLKGVDFDASVQPGDVIIVPESFF